MNFMNSSAALITVGLLGASPAFAQTPTAPVQKQPTQEGAPAFPEHCSRPYNANPAADPDCKQRTQNLVPSSNQAASTHK
jgi:hypothetical protein